MNTVHIWQMDKFNPRGINLEFMYAPIRNTLIEGFKNLNVKIDVKNNCFKWELLLEKDIFIWIGCTIGAKEKIPWIELKARNVYTIYYQTEPSAKSYVNNNLCHEIWDYSFKNVQIIKQLVGNNKIVRYVPPGYLKNEKIIQKKIKNKKLIFLGTWWNRSKFNTLEKQMNSKKNKKLIKTNSIWNKQQWKKFINKKYNGIFINLHKDGCDNMEAVRMSQLLSVGGIIISEKANEFDMGEYKDYVIFTDNYQKEYNKLLQLTQSEIQEKADNILNKYKINFSPSNIFKKAGINTLLETAFKI